MSKKQMTEIKNKQDEMENFYDKLIKIILTDKNTGLVPTLNPKFINCNYEEKSLTLELIVKEWQLNPEKILFGGVIVSMLDTAYGFLCHYFANNRFISTISLNTIFHKPGKLGDTIQVKVKADSCGRTIVNMSGEIYDITQSSKIATSQTSFMIHDKKINL